MNTQLAKCSCHQCGGHLEFEVAYAGEDVACPHCGKQTRLYVPVEATPSGVPDSSPAPPEPGSHSAYRVAYQQTAQAPAPRPPAARPRSQPPGGKNPFARHAAMASCLSFLLVIGLACIDELLSQKKPLMAWAEVLLKLSAPLFVVTGFSLGTIALFGIRKHGTRGILIPSLLGTVVNGLLLGIFCVGFYAGLDKASAARSRTAKSVTPATSTQSVRPQPASALPVEKKLSRAGEPIVTVLEPGAEPRKVLRFRPKVGDKQTAVFMMKLTMEPGPLTNLPAIEEPTEIVIKNVSTNGNIAYESLIKDVRLLAGSGAPAQGMVDMKAAFSIMKGIITSSVMSSRGSNRRAQYKNPKTDRILPAIVSLFHGQMHMALDNIVLPEEAIGAGGKWELRKESQNSVETTVYEIVSIENNRVTVRTTHTASESTQNTKGRAMTAGGSGEMTIDLTRVVPAKGNLVYRLEGSEPDGPGGTNVIMKMRTEVRIETK